MKQRTRQQMVSLWIIAALIAVALPYPSEAAEKIVLVSSQDTKLTFYGRWLNLIYTEAFRRLGYEFQYIGYPGARAPLMAERGKVDGEIHRAASYAKVAQNLLKLEEPSFSVIVAAYAVKPGIVMDGWESLKNTNYKVEYRRGSKVAQKALPAVVRPENLSTITTVEQGLNKLISGRTDIFVEQEPVVAETLRKLEKGNFASPIVYQAGIMWTGDSHVYLHKKHASLLPKIAEVLKAMKQEGAVERYKEAAQ